MIRKHPLAAVAVTVAALALPLGFASAAPAAAKKPSSTAAKRSTKKSTTKAPKKPSKAAATTTTVTACVKNKTGAVTVLLGSKVKKGCPKGSTKMTWNVAGKDGTNGKNGKDGASGANGSNGTNGADGTNGVNGTNASSFVVRDTNGTALGAFAGFSSLGLPLYQVLTDGGLYYYLPSGQLFPVPALFSGSGSGSTSFTSPLFRDAACAGTAYTPAPNAATASFYIQFLGASTRFVHRTMPAAGGGNPFPDPGALGPAKAWKMTAAHSTVADVDVWALDQATGVCARNPAPYDTADGITGELIALQAVPAPPDRVGPLTLG